jgi:hypothetical protein
MGGNLSPGYPLGYGCQWWACPGDPSFAPHDGAFTAAGIFDQFVCTSPAHRVMAEVWSAWPLFTSTATLVASSGVQRLTWIMGSSQLHFGHGHAAQLGQRCNHNGVILALRCA